MKMGKTITETMQIDRPLDALNSFRGYEVDVFIKDGDGPLTGKLLAFDIHINLVIQLDNKKIKFIKGDVVETVNPTK